MGVADDPGLRAEVSPTSITMRNMEAGLKQRLRRRAAHHGHAMEAEAPTILQHSPAPEPAAETLNLAEAIRRRMAPRGGVEQDLPRREQAREPPGFE